MGELPVSQESGLGWLTAEIGSGCCSLWSGNARGQEAAFQVVSLLPGRSVQCLDFHSNLSVPQAILTVSFATFGFDVSESSMVLLWPRLSGH